MPVRGYQGSDYLNVRPEVKTVSDPYTGQPILVVPPIIPDFCLIHAFFADESGNVLMERTADVDLAVKAAAEVIVSVEEKVLDLDKMRQPYMKRLPWVYVDHLVLAPGGAEPLGCPGRYETQIKVLEAYLRAFEAGREREFVEDLARDRDRS